PARHRRHWSPDEDILPDWHWVVTTRTMNAFARINTAIHSGARFTAILGGMGLVFATALTCVSILLKLLRRALDASLGTWIDPTYWAFVRPILGEEELVAYGVGFALFAALPWVTLTKGHIRVDLFEPWLGAQLNRVLDLLADVLIAGFAYLVFTRQWFLIFAKARRSQDPIGQEVLAGNFGVIADRLRDNQVSQILGLPLWPTYVVAQVLVGVLLIVALFCVWRSMRQLIQPIQVTQ
ncbi:MAG: TRAP transporter small permease, partial [Pseudomonadota bacterium]